MPWNEPGGNQQDPWGGKNRNTGKNQAGDLFNQLTKKLDELLKTGKRNTGGGNFSQENEPFNFKILLIILGVLVAGWLFSGFYTVGASQQALVLRFGAFHTTTGPGLRWHFPSPIEKVELIDVAQNRSAQDESTMLTKDENIVAITVNVQYRINNAQNYAFNVQHPDDLTGQKRGTLYQAMRSSIREVVGRNTMDYILGEGREQIAFDAQKLLQSILDRYAVGIDVIKVNLTDAQAPDEVKEAFDDANRAREDANRFQNEADTYANRVIPEARGKAARAMEDANAYRDQVVARAEGDASRFSQLVTQYNKAPDVTRERLYLETMENVMSGTRKVVVDSKDNVIYLPLDGNSKAPVDLPDAPPNPTTVTAPLVSDNASGRSSEGRQERSLTPRARESRQ
ncbi:FtsH protease activity modulator HflK [Thiolinea disciformis]|uniref:FtsH protease activity modulator HflK n=1 Tax=Thiolinea disciformis TaxID=125614 RepID=UPI000372C072|nr:FtsH protease activity modulator HflK [Thiolinea disciformis]